MKQKIVVRKARSSDSDAVFKFCEKTWDWGDYVPRVWNHWLEEKDGRIFVATINDIPVGISHVKILKQERPGWKLLGQTQITGEKVSPPQSQGNASSSLFKKA